MTLMQCTNSKSQFHSHSIRAHHSRAKTKSKAPPPKEMNTKLRFLKLFTWLFECKFSTSFVFSRAMKQTQMHVGCVFSTYSSILVLQSLFSAGEKETSGESAEKTTKSSAIKSYERIKRVKRKKELLLQLSKCHLTSSNFKNGLPPTTPH